jgi:Flp pilus assembly pilin Flp
VRPLIGRFLHDESGQDGIEYALLTAGIGIAGIALWPVIEAQIRTSYQNLDTGTQNLWIPPNPGGGS